MVNLFFFKTFVDTARSGSVKAAAAKNYVTQPAVTQHIHQLEQKLECRLFERQHKKMSLTPCGKLFLSTAEQILRAYKDSKVRLRELNQKVSGTIRIATIYSIGLYQLQSIVRKFLKKFPKIEVHLEYQPFGKIYDLLVEQNIDFGFVAHPKKRQGVITEIFDEEELVLAQSPEHRTLPRKKLDLRELHDAKFVTFSSGTPTREHIDDFFQSKGIYPKVVNEYDNIETLKSAIQLGMGCSIVPKNTLSRELKDKIIEIIPVEGLKLKRPLGILLLKDKVLSQGARAFYDMIVKS